MPQKIASMLGNNTVRKKKLNLDLHNTIEDIQYQEIFQNFDFS